MIGLVRALALFVPLLIAVSMWVWRQPRGRERTALLVALCWNGTALLLLQALAGGRWWTFGEGVEGGLIFGMPAEIWIGWTVLWGFFTLLSTNLWVVVAAAVFVDIQLMPHLEPVLVLGPDWLLGEAVAVAVALVPACVLARLTAEQRATGWRAAGQVVWFWLAAFVLLPLIAEAQVENGAWQLLLLPLGWFAAAALGFVEDGGGTPIPMDAPRRLVTTGPYAYVRNPMQLSSALAFLVLGVAMASPVIAAGAAVVFVYSVGFATWHEDRTMAYEGWEPYRSAVRAWLPRWRPYEGPTAVLYYEAGCGLCSELAEKIVALSPTALEVRPASTHPESLARVRWEREGCPDADGLVALCRALEQVNLGWASVAMFGRLPGIAFLLQMVVDALGGAPRSARTEPSMRRRPACGD